MTSSSQKPQPDDKQQSRMLEITPAGFEPAIPACKRPQTLAVDRTANGIDVVSVWISKLLLARAGLCTGVLITMFRSYRNFLCFFILISSVRIHVFVVTYLKSFWLNLLVLWTGEYLLNEFICTCVCVFVSTEYCNFFFTFLLILNKLYLLFFDLLLSFNVTCNAIRLHSFHFLSRCWDTV
jgi:hypothetical protein